MFTFINNLRSKLFYHEEIKENETKSLARQIDDYLSEIDEIRPRNVNEESPQSNLIDDEEGSFLKVGIISHVTNDSIIIENKYMCEWKNIIPTNLKIGDEVQYSAYKLDKDGDLRIRRVNCKIDSSYWDTEKYDENLENNEDGVQNNGESVNLDIETVPSTGQVVEGFSDRVIDRKGINRRTIVGKVHRRKGREIFLEEDNICINLDRVSSEFVPVVGDWVQLQCIVEVNEDVPNFKGEILETESILPLRQLNKLGKVTEYNEGLESGTVEKNIVFSKAVCMPGYIPCVGDKVVVQSIESDQGLQQNWRALQVVPLENVPNRFETSTIKFKPQLPEDELADLLKDKENIAITDQVSVSLEAKTETVVDVFVKNNGSNPQKIIKCAFLSRLSDSQLSVLLPLNNEPQMLQPSEEIKYRFKVRAKFVGASEELIIFKFKQFKIARIIKITVKSINTTNQDSNKIVTNRYVKHKTTVVRENYEEGMYIRGVKPYTPAKFIAQRPVTWKIPDILWNTIHSIIEERKTRTEAEQSVQDKIPCLEKHLCFENYKQRFDYLLYLEEIEQTLNMQKFSMSSATMHRSAEYLTLNVPGLAEKRPSLITGDKVIVSFKWDETGGKRKFEGFIHKIKSSDIYLKFDPKFHEDYHGEDCQIEFKGSTTVIQRCHTAVATVVNRLGRDILFPKKVVQKDPQYNFVDDDEEKNPDEKTDEPQSDDEAIDEDGIKVNGENDEIVNGTNSSDSTLKKIEAYLYSRHIKWFNKQLNVYQKEAIKNVLKGLARPLPYIIFGPPGTGKTVTVCEGILQILTTITESRILIATPSNSSANLIAERLLDSKQLKPGDMVRLVAHHYFDSDSIPEKILPFCVTADISSEGSRSGVNLEDDRGRKTNVTLSVLCRHRIIIGTCSALGILYNMGCKPGHFTHIVIDEAGQATEPEIMVPLSLAHASFSQIVLAGDPKQLGPVNQSRLANYFGLDVSFLVRLLQQFPYQRDPIGFKTGYDPRLITKLLMNYRSLPDLLYLPNKLFYEAELIPQVHPEDSDEAELLMSLSDMLPKRLGAPPSVIFHGVNGTNMQEQDSPSWYNPEEATQVYIYLLELYNHGLEPDDIGIISPYSKQVFKIKHLLAELDVEIPKVGSVEEFQGQERKVILLSTVRTATDKLRDDVRHALGFVAAPTRLNVAITRARTLLIIIGCPKLLLEDVYWRSVLDHCAKRNSWVGHKIEN